MPGILVVVDAVDGSVPKPTLELLTLARRIGTPAAVVFGPAASQAVPALGEYGAADVYLVPDRAGARASGGAESRRAAADRRADRR